MAVWKSSKNVLITCVLGVFVLVLGTIGIGERFFPTIVPDEVGYWTFAAFLHGDDWSSVMQNSPTYGIGYGILLAPIYLIENPLLRYRVALILNALMLLGVYLLALRVSQKLFGSIAFPIRALACFLVAIYPYNVFYTKYTMTEVVLTFFYWVLLYRFVLYLQKNTYLNAICLSVSAAYLYMLHMRSLGVLLAMAVILLWNAVRNRGNNWGQTVVLFVTMAGLLFGISLLRDVYVQTEYVYESAETIINEASTGIEALENVKEDVNGFGSQLSKMQKLFSLQGMLHFLTGMGGRFFYLGVATFSLFYAALAFVLASVKNFFELPKEERKGLLAHNIMTLVFLSLSVLFSLGISTISMIEPARMDTVMYGRYTDSYIGPLLLIGILYFCRLAGKKKANLVAVACIIQVCFSVVIYFYIRDNNITQMSPNSIIGMYGLPTITGISDAVFYTFVAVAWGIAGTCILALCAGKEKKSQTAFLIVMSIMFSYVGYHAFAKGAVSVPEEKAMMQDVENVTDVLKQTETAGIWFLFDETLQEMRESNARYTMYELQFAFAKEKYHTVTLEKLEQIPATDIVIAQNGWQIAKKLEKLGFYEYESNGTFVTYLHYTNPSFGTQQSNTVDLEDMLIQNRTSRLEKDGTETYILAGSNEGEYCISGPYITLEPGTYQLYLTLECIKDGGDMAEVEDDGRLGYCDVSAANGEMILATETLTEQNFAQNANAQTVTLEFSSSAFASLTGVEFRLFVEPGVQFRVTDISYQCVSLERQAMLPESEDYQLLRGVLDRDTDVLPVRIIAEDGLEPLLSCSQLQEALADTGREVSIVKRSELGRDPAVLLVPAEDTDLLFDLLPDFTVLVRMEEYALLVPSGYSVETAFRDVGGRPMSEGNALNLRYFLGAGEASYGNLAVNIPAGDYELRYRLSLNGTPLWSELGTLTLSGGNLSEQESLTAELFDDGYGTYENSRMLSLEESGQLRVGVSVHSGVSVVGLEAYLIRQ